MIFKNINMILLIFVSSIYMHGKETSLTQLSCDEQNGTLPSSHIRQKVSSGTIWESIASFSRAIRINDHIFIAGTTATDGNNIIGIDDIVKQTEFIFNRIEDVLKELGGTLEDVVRTRIYVKNINDWEIVAKMHGAVFKNVKPVCTLVQANLVSGCLVEIEAEAIVLK